MKDSKKIFLLVCILSLFIFVFSFSFADAIEIVKDTGHDSGENKYEEIIYSKKPLTEEKVKWLQESLKIAGFYTARDGSFGPNTKLQLKKFKESKGFESDSIFDEVIEKEFNKIRKNLVAKNIGTSKILANKSYFLPSDYKPEVLIADVKSYKDIWVSKDIKSSLEKMFSDAKKEGYTLLLLSGYRSYDYQETLFRRRVNYEGFEKAQKIIAIPGESEHQTGLAIDVSSKEIGYELGNRFEDTGAFTWLMENSYKYGFILRYLKDKTDVTGYLYEPWHYRYIDDIEIAKYIMENDLTYEEYLLLEENDLLKKDPN